MSLLASPFPFMFTFPFSFSFSFPFQLLLLEFLIPLVSFFFPLSGQCLVTLVITVPKSAEDDRLGRDDNRRFVEEG